MKTYYIPQPQDPPLRQALNLLLNGLEQFYQIECQDVISITTDLASLDGVLSGLAVHVVGESEPPAPAKSKKAKAPAVTVINSVVTVEPAAPESQAPLPPEIRSSAKVEPEEHTCPGCGKPNRTGKLCRACFGKQPAETKETAEPGPAEPAASFGPGVKVISEGDLPADFQRRIARHGAIGGHKL